MSAPSPRPRSPLRGLRLALYRVLRRKTARLDGLTVLCDPARVPRSVAAAIIKGGYELPERELVRAAIRHVDRVVEVGAGVGIVGLVCTTLAGPGRVLSYEANATLEPIITANYALNGLTPRLRLRAVTSDGAPVSFYRNDNIVSSSVLDRGLAAQKVVVPSDALVTVLAEEGADVLVMDIEGAEIDLLSATDLTGLREIIVETHPHIVGAAATQAMVDAILAQGFTETGRVHKNIRLSRR